VYIFPQEMSPRADVKPVANEARPRGPRRPLTARARPGYLVVSAVNVSVRALLVRSLLPSMAGSIRSRPLGEKRARMDRLSARSRLPGGTTVAPLLTPHVRGEWVRVPSSREDRVILYLHGGAFSLGSPATHRAMVARICAESAARAFSLDYRLAPEHPFPAAVEDAVAAYRYLRDRGVAPTRTAFAGDSAGANLVLAALLALRDAGEPLPAAAVCISPPTDLTGGSESLATNAKLDPLVSVESVAPLLRGYVGAVPPDNPGVSPLLADLRGLPPLLLHVGSREILYDDSLRFARKAREAGVEVRLEVGAGLWHVWHATAPFVPEAGAAIRSIGRFLGERVPDCPPAG
jgi:epsilon-lactone hydrolase